MNTLDFASSVVGLASSLCAIGLHVVTAPGRGAWISLPWLVRVPLFLMAAGQLGWAVNLLLLSSDPRGIGHINIISATASATNLLFLLAAFVYAVSTNRLHSY